MGILSVTWLIDVSLSPLLFSNPPVVSFSVSYRGAIVSLGAVWILGHLILILSISTSAKSLFLIGSPFEVSGEHELLGESGHCLTLYSGVGMAVSDGPET